MKGIRPLTEADVAGVATLHRLALGEVSVLTPDILDEYRRWLVTVFLDNPMCAGDSASIVYEEHGEVIGFLGVIARQFTLNHRTCRATATSNFCVHPQKRGIIGLQMLTHFLQRRGDLAFVDEVNDRPRELLERLGYVVSPTQSVRWVVALRPTAHAVSLVRHRLPAPVAALGAQVARGCDAALRRMPRSPFRYDAPDLDAATLSPADLARLLQEFGTDHLLRPVTSDGSTAWLIERARGMTQHGELQMIVLRDRAGGVAGWYIYYAKPNAQGEVLQLVATRTSAGAVLDHLAHHASIRGVVSLSGTLHPDFLQPLASRRAAFMSGSRWMLVHCDDRAMLESFWRGNLLLSRLDGEWCQHLR